MKIAALIAGLVLSSAAMAQQVDISEKIPASQIKHMPRECFAGNLHPRDFDSRTVAPIYDNLSASPAFYTTTAATNIILDDITLAEGPGIGATFPLTLSTFNIAFQVKTLAAANFDLEVTFFNSVNPTAAAGTAVTAGQTPIGGFILPFRNIPATGVYDIGDVDISTIALALPDAGAFVRVRFLQAGSTTALMATTTVGAAFPQTLDETATWKSFNVAGTSLSGAWVNLDADATALEAADRANFGYPACLDLGLTIKADVPVNTSTCPADFNGDNVLDFFDYLDFVAAFANGC
jgi:hypothetical protein